MNEEPGGHGNKKKLAVVIMASEAKTLQNTRRPGVLHAVGGKPLLAHVIAVASQIVEPADIYVIVGYLAERVQAEVTAAGVHLVNQSGQHGTGHAVFCAREAIENYDNMIFLPGNIPAIHVETICEVWNFHQIERAAMTVLSAVPDDPTGYARILRASDDSHGVQAIIEQDELAKGQQNLTEISSGIYAFQTASLLGCLDSLAANNALGERDLACVAGSLIAAGERVVAVKAGSSAEILGLRSIAELVSLDASLRTATVGRLMAGGVTIYRPETCVIDAEVEVAPDTIIEPFVQLLGSTRIGSDCLIRSYSVIENCTVGDGALIRQSCVLEESTVADGAQIGPFAHLRPGSEIGEGAHIGNFVETKKAKLGKGVKAGHLTYLGDTEIGEGTNIGAGVITCNYDGVHKHKTTIGKNVFVGSDSTLVAPVTLEDGAYVGAGSCITKVVPEGSLAVARAHQFVKEGWVAARRTRQKTQE